jgi:hypothetical protein
MDTKKASSSREATETRPKVSSTRQQVPLKPTLHQEKRSVLTEVVSAKKAASAKIRMWQVDDEAMDVDVDDALLKRQQAENEADDEVVEVEDGELNGGEAEGDGEGLDDNGNEEVSSPNNNYDKMQTYLYCPYRISFPRW